MTSPLFIPRVSFHKTEMRDVGENKKPENVEMKLAEMASIFRYKSFLVNKKKVALVRCGEASGGKREAYVLEIGIYLRFDRV